LCVVPSSWFRKSLSGSLSFYDFQGKAFKPCSGFLLEIPPDAGFVLQINAAFHSNNKPYLKINKTVMAIENRLQL
jgi:hypothetical protein